MYSQFSVDKIVNIRKLHHVFANSTWNFWETEWKNDDKEKKKRNQRPKIKGNQKALFNQSKSLRKLKEKNYHRKENRSTKKCHVIRKFEIKWRWNRLMRTRKRGQTKRKEECEKAKIDNKRTDLIKLLGLVVLLWCTHIIQVDVRTKMNMPNHRITTNISMDTL